MKSLNIFLKTVFYRLGGIIAHYPKLSIGIPVVITIFLCFGFLRIYIENDFEYLYTPTTGRSIHERAQLFHYFPANDSSQFSISRKATLGHFLRYPNPIKLFITYIL